MYASNHIFRSPIPKMTQTLQHQRLQPTIGCNGGTHGTEIFREPELPASIGPPLISPAFGNTPSVTGHEPPVGDDDDNDEDDEYDNPPNDSEGMLLSGLLEQSTSVSNRQRKPRPTVKTLPYEIRTTVMIAISFFQCWVASQSPFTRSAEKERGIQEAWNFACHKERKQLLLSTDIKTLVRYSTLNLIAH